MFCQCCFTHLNSEPGDITPASFLLAAVVVVLQSLCSATSLDDVRSAANTFLQSVMNLCNCRPAGKGPGATWRHIGGKLSKLMDLALEAAAAASSVRDLRAAIAKVRAACKGHRQMRISGGLVSRSQQEEDGMNEATHLLCPSVHVQASAPSCCVLLAQRGLVCLMLACWHLPCASCSTIPLPVTNWRSWPSSAAAAAASHVA
jgi:hypothetical protein